MEPSLKHLLSAGIMGELVHHGRAGASLVHASLPSSRNEEVPGKLESGDLSAANKSSM